MARPNQHLESALAAFANQPGTTVEQAAQLRAALVVDNDRLRQFNQLAAAGQLKSFALEAPGDPTSLIGTYDKQAGVVTLPLAGFQPGSATASGHLNAMVGLQAMSVDFAFKTWTDSAGQAQTVTQEMVSNLQATLNGSPALAEQAKEAVTRGHVRHFGLLDGSMAAGATYDGNAVRESPDHTPKGINLPPAALQTNSVANPLGRYDARDMTFVLGHEIQHGFNDATKDQARRTFDQAIRQQARVRGPMHDYTDEIRDYIQAGREDEAGAEIAGWNALLSRERQLNNTADGLDMMLFSGNGRVLDFVGRDAKNPGKAIANAGLSFNQDGTLSQTPGNIAAMGQHYFDRPSRLYAQPGERPVHIGEHKPVATSDYINYYGTVALEKIIAAEDRANVRYQGSRPQIAINMASIGLKEDLIEMEGLNLGRNKAARLYLDTSQNPGVSGLFHHTQDGSVNAQHNHQHVPTTSAESAQSGTPPVDSRHPDHALRQKLRESVRGLDQQAGKGWDDASERLSASALVMAKQGGFNEQDDLRLAFNLPTQRHAGGDVLHLVRVGAGASSDPVANRVHMPTSDALAVPAEDRLRQAEVITQDNAQQAQRLQQANRQDDPARSGPAMQM